MLTDIREVTEPMSRPIPGQNQTPAGTTTIQAGVIAIHTPGNAVAHVMNLATLPLITQAILTRHHKTHTEAGNYHG